MNEAVLQLFNDEAFKEGYYTEAQKLIDAAGINNIKVDRTQFTARTNGDKIVIKIAVRKFTKHTVSAKELRTLKRINAYKPVYDRYKKNKPFEERPLYEWGYIELEYPPHNNH